MFTYELQRRLQGIDHHRRRRTPRRLQHRTGAQSARRDARVATVLAPLFQGPDMGALPTLRAATDPGVLGGQYFGPDGFGEQRGYPKVVASSAASHDFDAQRRLWTVSEELTGVAFPVG